MKINSNIEPKEHIKIKRSYKASVGIAKWLDKYYLDAAIGFIPNIGDIIGSIFSIPFIYLSLFVIKSIPLTIAIIKNNLLDALIGMVPFWLGNILDIFHRAHQKNMILIEGFVEGDKKVVDEVNRTAFAAAIVCVVIIFLIYLVFKFAEFIYDKLSELLSMIF